MTMSGLGQESWGSFSSRQWALEWGGEAVVKEEGGRQLVGAGVEKERD